VDWVVVGLKEMSLRIVYMFHYKLREFEKEYHGKLREFQVKK